MAGRTTPEAMPAGRDPICRHELTRLKADAPSLMTGCLMIGSLKCFPISTGLLSGRPQFRDSG